MCRSTEKLGSSKVRSTPGSPYCTAPLYRNCDRKVVLPVPDSPMTSVVDTGSNPPLISSSSPVIPEGTLLSGPEAASADAAAGESFWDSFGLSSSPRFTGCTVGLSLRSTLVSGVAINLHRLSSAKVLQERL